MSQVRAKSIKQILGFVPVIPTGEEITNLSYIYDLYLYGDFLRMTNLIVKYGEFNFFRDLATMLYETRKRKRDAHIIYKHVTDLYFSAFDSWIYYYFYNFTHTKNETENEDNNYEHRGQNVSG